MGEIPLPILIQRISREIAAQPPEFRYRVVQWAVAAAEKGGVSREVVLHLLDGKSPERHWWHIRQVLPESAIRSLYERIVSEFGIIPTQIEEEDEWIEVS